MRVARRRLYIWDTVYPFILIYFLGTLTVCNGISACKDFIDLKFIIENKKISLPFLLQAVGRKYNVGEEMFFQLKKSLVYFDDAERDLNVNMFAPQSGKFERLSPGEWLKTKQFFYSLLG